MFIKAVKEYITKNSYYFKHIEIKHFYEVNDSKLTALSVAVDNLTTNVYDYLVEAISECIIDEVSKATLGAWYNLYLVTTIAPSYEELDDKVTARVGFKILNNYAN